jgi:hypothetical protein
MQVTNDFILLSNYIVYKFWDFKTPCDGIVLPHEVMSFGNQ